MVRLVRLTVLLLTLFSGTSGTEKKPVVQEEVKCSMPTINPNTIVGVNYKYDLDDSIASDTMFPEGTILVTRCRDIGKYILSNGGERQCKNGHWTRTPATCTVSSNRLLFKKEPSLNYMIRKVAPDGTYYMVEGEWKGIKVQCSVVDDAEFEFEPDDGITVLELEGDGIFSQSDVYFVVSRKEHSGRYTCWDRDNVEKPRISVVIKIIDYLCEEKFIENGRAEVTTVGTFGWGKTLTFSCNLNYRLVGDSVLECLYNGQWDHPFPHCVYETACDIPLVLNSVIYVNNQRTIQSKADNRDSVIISCNQGYTFADGKTSISGTCIDSTIIYEEDIELVCDKPSVCTQPPTEIGNGFIIGTGTSEKSVVGVYCLVDFVIPGTDKTRQNSECRGRSWIPPLPSSCVKSSSTSSDTNSEASSSSSSTVSAIFCNDCPSESKNSVCKKRRIYPINGRIISAEPALNPTDLKVTIEVIEWLKVHDGSGEPEILDLTIENALNGDCYCPAGLGLNSDLRIYIRYNAGFKLVTKSYIAQDTLSALPKCL